VLKRTYGFVGSEMDLGRRGVLSAGWLAGLKARVAMSLALRHQYRTDEIADLLDLFAGERDR
jgi:L-asparaginase